ncbi:MAG: HATPase c protein, partial [Anaerolineales bacterium]|nr:HATPase c protein [Anaerolineales bacterium]
MAKHPSRPYPLIEQIIALLVLAVILLYTYSLFVRLPYLCFEWDSATGRVRRLFVTAELQADDQILQIGPTAVADFQADLRQTILENIRPGEAVPLIIRRGGQMITLRWVIPNSNRSEFYDRIFSQWWLALLFWAAGQTILLVLRPRDTRWRLLMAFNFVTALWLGASAVSRWHLWDSALALRATMWLWIPIYWHL